MFVVMLISWLLFGLIVGLIARAIFPGAQGMGFFATAILGIVGSFMGGLVANFFWGGQILAVQPSGFIGSLVGSLLVLALMGLAGRTSHA